MMTNDRERPPTINNGYIQDDLEKMTRYDMKGDSLINRRRPPLNTLYNA